MPDALGEWTYTTRSNRPQLDGKTGRFVCIGPASGNHGPVRVHNTYHFAYADGTPYFQVGTTCYAWVHQPEALQQQTLKTLAASPFNKIRFCVFPKSYGYNANEPEGSPREAAGEEGKGYASPQRAADVRPWWPQVFQRPFSAPADRPANMAEMPPDLAQVVAAWLKLPEHIKAAVLALAKAAGA
jgi:hypothetical protein